MIGKSLHSATLAAQVLGWTDTANRRGYPADPHRDDIPA
jgi:hypothetical protein